EYPRDKCIHELFEEQVERTPDAVAVVFENQQLTYRELNRRANQLARYLRRTGIKPDSLVGICFERSLEMVIGLIGIWKAGAAYVPLDSEYPPDRLGWMLADSRAPILVTTRELAQTLHLSATNVIVWENVAAQLAAEEQDNLPCEFEPNHSAY